VPLPEVAQLFQASLVVVLSLAVIRLQLIVGIAGTVGSVVAEAEVVVLVVPDVAATALTVIE